MRRFILRIRFPTGTVLVGGHSALPGGVSSSHAVDHQGRPTVPATSLRGGLRETLEALLRGVGRGACDGGSGVDPAHPTDDRGPRACTVDEGQRCIPCRIFGTQRAAVSPEERSFSSVILGNAVLDGDEPPEWVLRQHVAISRVHHSAEDQRLFQRRTPELTERSLLAHGYSVDDVLVPYLEAAVRGTKHLGSGRSVGLARVELEIEWQDDIDLELSAATTTTEEARHDVEVRVRLESPAALGTAEASSNYRASRSEIPGSAFRGALGFAIARAAPEQDGTEFQEVLDELVDEDRGAQFGFLHPVDDVRDSPGDRPGPWPVTARACKAHGSAHAVVDTLLDRIAVECVSSVDQAKNVRRHMLRTCRAGTSECGAPLRSAKGSRAHPGTPSKRVVTRVSIDRRTTSARDGALFSYELVEAGTVFQGSIRNVPARARALLESGLRLPLFVGRGASAGWGKVSVEILEPPARPSLVQRGTAFESALRQRLEAADLPTDDVDHIVPITFLGPYLPGGDDDVHPLTERLGESTQWTLVARRFDRDGGWDQRSGRPFAELAVAAGAVYVARLAQPWRDYLEALEALERSGAGCRRHQGFGHLMVFDPFILTREHAQ